MLLIIPSLFLIFQSGNVLCDLFYLFSQKTFAIKLAQSSVTGVEYSALKLCTISTARCLDKYECMLGCVQNLEYHSVEMNFGGNGFEFLENHLIQEHESQTNSYRNQCKHHPFKIICKEGCHQPATEQYRAAWEHCSE